MQTTGQDETSGPTADTAAIPRPAFSKGQRGRPRRGAKLPPKKILKLSIGHDTYEQLGIHALKGGISISRLIEKLASDHLRDWVLHARPGPKA